MFLCCLRAFFSIEAALIFLHFFLSLKHRHKKKLQMATLSLFIHLSHPNDDLKYIKIEQWVLSFV